MFDEKFLTLLLLFFPGIVGVLFIKCVRTLVALALVRVLAVRQVLVGYE